MPLQMARRCLIDTLIVPFLLPALLYASASATGHRGYYGHPAVHGHTVVFTSEGDLWSVDIQGGPARRLTTNTGIATMPAISPDGKTIAFSAQYEGPFDVYTIPLEGGLPQRRSWDGDAMVEGWTPDGRLIVNTKRYSTLPEPRLVLLGEQGQRDSIPLAAASEAAYSTDGKVLFFTRFDKQWSYTKRYKGGWAQSLWRFDGAGEAAPLTAGYTGTSHNPMYWNGRVYFVSDRDGVMNVYSMTAEGKDVRQESRQATFDVSAASLSEGHIVYASGADLWDLDLQSGTEKIIPISLVSDFDQLREHWVAKPSEFLTGTHISPDGSEAVFTARGEIFTIPAKSGRIVKVAGDSSIRYREARFLPDGKSIVALSTQSGETEFWKFPANGEGKPEQWTHDAKVLRWEGVPSPDGRWLAHHDKDQQLWVYDIKNKSDKKIAQSMNGDYADLSWSPDSAWLAYTESADNNFLRIKVLQLASGNIETITSDRYNSMNPVWSRDGKWLYFLSDRMLQSTVNSPWGNRQPDPHFDRQVKIYELALTAELRSPFLPPDELHPDASEKNTGDHTDEAGVLDGKAAKDNKSGADSKSRTKQEEKPGTEADAAKIPEVKIDLNGLSSRLSEVPAPAGNYNQLQLAEKRLCWLNATDEADPKQSLQCLDIANKGDEVETVMSDVKGYEISLDRKKLLLSKGDDFYVLDSDIKAAALNDPKTLGKAQLNLSRWSFSTNPQAEYRGLFLDAWRLERDYFYDRGMQGVDWPAMRDRYLPLVDRVSSRDELNDVIAQMVGELSALHTFVRGGDARKPSDRIDLATLGAKLRRDEKAGGFVVEHIYLHDPDLPSTAPPLARPDSLVREGEVVVSIDGTDLLSVEDERVLLRNKAGARVLLRIKSAAGEQRDVLVTPVSAMDDAELRYAEWEYSRRLKVETDSGSKIGYVHLRAMGTEDIAQWARDFDPVYNRKGLIIDVRHNQGGNIDSWLLGKLLRQAWFYFQPRIGNPDWNMQGAFRGHIVVLCDQQTASDGEAFTEGFKRFHLGQVVGARTWGGEIWLSGSNVQADGGVATAAEIGVYGPEGKWLIEGHGVDPDRTVDNLPHETYGGKDAQLEAAEDLLLKEIQQDPRPVPKAPPYPDKSFKN